MHMTMRTVDGIDLTRIDGGWSWPGGRFDFIHATDLDDAAGWRVHGFGPDAWRVMFPTLKQAVANARQHLELERLGNLK